MACVTHCFVYFVDIFGNLLGDNLGSNVLVLGKEDNDFVTAHLDSHVAADCVLDYDADEGAHHEM